MKRISGGQLSREAKATLLSSHAGGPRTAAGDKTFVGQTKAADAVVKSQPAASPKDLPVGSDVTAQTTKHFGSDSRLIRDPTRFCSSTRSGRDGRRFRCLARSGCQIRVAADCSLTGLLARSLLTRGFSIGEQRSQGPLCSGTCFRDNAGTPLATVECRARRGPFAPRRRAAPWRSKMIALPFGLRG